MAGPAAAQLYLGATIGQAEFKEGCLGTGECDDEDTAWRILGGYQFNKFFAAELGYYDFGEASSGAAKLEAEEFELVAVGSFHLTDRFSVYGKLGGYQGTLEGSGVDEDTTDLTYGLRANTREPPRTGLRQHASRNVRSRSRPARCFPITARRRFAMKSLTALLAAAGVAAAFTFAGPAAAQAGWRNMYLGATVGQSEFQDGCRGVANCDDEDTALRIFAGYQFNRYFAAELGYHELGEAETSAGNNEGKAWELVAIASFPFTDKFFVFAKLGGYWGQLEGPHDDEDNADVTYGVGLRYDFTRHWGVRGEWQRYSNMGGGNLINTDVDVLSVGFIYRFQ